MGNGFGGAARGAAARAAGFSSVETLTAAVDTVEALSDGADDTVVADALMEGTEDDEDEGAGSFEEPKLGPETTTERGGGIG